MVFLEDLQYSGQVFDHRVRCGTVIVLSMRKVMPDLDGQSKPRAARAFDIARDPVSHIDALTGGNVRQPRRIMENSGVWFAAAVLTR